MSETVHHQRKKSIIFEKIEKNINDLQDELDGKIKNSNDLKIGLVGAFSDKWSSSHGVLQALKRHAEVNKVFELDYRQLMKNDQNTLKRRMIALADKSDVLIICKGNGIHPNIIKHCAGRCRIYLYWMDWWKNLKSDRNLLEYSKYCDWRSMTGYGDAMKWQNAIGLKVHHVLDGAEPNWFYPVEAKKEYDVTFIGGRDQERSIVLDHLTDAGIRVNFFGPGFTKFVNPNEFRSICNKSKITLNISRGKSEGYSSLRLWNLLACGSMVMTKQIPNMELRMGLKEENHIVSFSSLMDLINKARYYIENNEEREAIASNGYKWVMANRTWNNTAEDFIHIIKNEKPTKLGV